mmetsp:Transcript_15704/g.36167  ORF Transcript_15704/g.36167 Transcript_15704/m.36167 type:complete len:227 (-) Transcript_15704:1551-2231(-)
MRVRRHTNIRKWQLQRSNTLLLGAKPSDRSVNLMDKETLGSNRQETKDTVQCIHNSCFFGKFERFQIHLDMVVRKRLLRHFTENKLQWQINWSGSVLRIVHYDSSITGYLTQNSNGTVFAFCHLFKQLSTFWTKKKPIVLLVFGTPNLKYRESIIPNIYLTDIVRRTNRFNKLLQNVSVSARTLIVYRNNRIIISKVAASPHQTVHTVFHFGVSSLDSIEIKVGVL